MHFFTRFLCLVMLSASLAAGAASVDSGLVFGAGTKKGGLEVPADQYYMLSPFPQVTEHYDSRVIGPVEARDVVGRAVWVWWPLRNRRKL